MFPVSKIDIIADSAPMGGLFSAPKDTKILDENDVDEVVDLLLSSKRTLVILS